MNATTIDRPRIIRVCMGETCWHLIDCDTGNPMTSPRSAATHDAAWRNGLRAAERRGYKLLSWDGKYAQFERTDYFMRRFGIIA